MFIKKPSKKLKGEKKPKENNTIESQRIEFSSSKDERFQISKNITLNVVSKDQPKIEKVENIVISSNLITEGEERRQTEKSEKDEIRLTTDGNNQARPTYRSTNFFETETKVSADKPATGYH